MPFGPVNTPSVTLAGALAIEAQALRTMAKEIVAIVDLRASESIFSCMVVPG
jgi:hypothetical protein